MSINKVIKKTVFYISVRLASPVCVASGDDEATDRDVQVDYDNHPFIPGSSLAGAMRDYLQFRKTEDCIFGYAKENDKGEMCGKMSALYVSDFTFDTKPTIVTRDSVALSETKTAITGAKFDMQAIDTGAEGHFFIELVIRENDNASKMQQQLTLAISGLKNHEIRLGAKKTRGYGEIDITAIRKKEYNSENILEYLSAYDFKKAQIELKDISEAFFQETTPRDYVLLEVPLILLGAISIRQYAAKKEQPDFVHVTADGKAVVPGTSFAGAIRHRISEFLSQAGVLNIEGILSEMFGFVDIDNDKSKKSNVMISESVIHGARGLTMVRTGISRFESSAKKTALYKETAQVGGNLNLEIRVRKNADTDWMIGLLLLAIQDLEKGYLPVGGETSIGRGIFAVDEEKMPEGIAYLDGDLITEKDEEKYLGGILAELRRTVI